MNRRRILVVDDSSVLTDLFRRVLEATGRFIVREVNDGEMAVDAARDFRPDLILLDDDLGNMRGSEILARLRADGEFSSVPTAFITGSMRREEADEHGLKGLRTLAKPVWPGDLVGLAMELLEVGRRDSKRQVHGDLLDAGVVASQNTISCARPFSPWLTGTTSISSERPRAL